MTEFRAATPHPINLDWGNEREILQPSGVVPRIETTREKSRDVGNSNGGFLTVNKAGYGSVVNIPEATDGVIWLVGAMFIGHPDLSGRKDILALDTQQNVIRETDENGKPVMWVTQLFEISEVNPVSPEILGGY